jgi:hypothetical protein
MEVKNNGGVTIINFLLIEEKNAEVTSQTRVLKKN